MRIEKASYKVVGPKGNMTITMFRVKGLRLRRKVPVARTGKK